MTKQQMDEYDSNLLVVAAVDGFAHNHNISALEAYNKLCSCSALKLIRENYETLHTQDMSESVNFAEDIVKRSLFQ